MGGLGGGAHGAEDGEMDDEGGTVNGMAVDGPHPSAGKAGGGYKKWGSAAGRVEEPRPFSLPCGCTTWMVEGGEEEEMEEWGLEGVRSGAEGEEEVEANAWATEEEDGVAVATSSSSAAGVASSFGGGQGGISIPVSGRGPRPNSAGSSDSEHEEEEDVFGSLPKPAALARHNLRYAGSEGRRTPPPTTSFGSGRGLGHKRTESTGNLSSLSFKREGDGCSPASSACSTPRFSLSGGLKKSSSCSNLAALRGRWACADCGWESPDMGQYFRPPSVNMLLERLEKVQAMEERRKGGNLSSSEEEEFEANKMPATEGEEDEDEERKSRSTIVLPTCAICCDTLSEPCTLPCGHNFDISCLKSALLRSRQCPLCRLPLPPNMPIRENAALAKILLSLGSDEISGRKEEMKASNAITDAAREGEGEKIRRALREHGGEVEEAVLTEALVTAASCGHSSALHALVTGSNPSPAALTAALMLAIRHTHDAVSLLLDAGADASVKEEDSEEPLLVVATRLGDVNIVSTLLSAGGDTESTGPCGATPLVLAAELGYANVAQVLVDAGADVDFADETGMTALLAASTGGHAGVIRVLHSAGADLKTQDEDGLTPIFAAAEDGHGEAVEALLGLGVDPDERNECGETPLMAAARHGKDTALLALLSGGAAVDVARPDGATALFCAALAGKEEAIKLLIKAGANAEVSLDNGVTPLIGAVFCQHVGAVRALLAHVSCHVDLNRGDKGGANPLIYAAMLNNVEIAQLLLQQNIDLECRMIHGETAFFVACEKNCEDIARLLLKAGANKEVENNSGVSALVAAKVNNCDRIVSMIDEYEDRCAR